MKNTIKITVIGSLIIIAVLLSACSIARPYTSYQLTTAPEYGYGSGMMGAGMMSDGHMGGGMMGGYNQMAPTAEVTPNGATPFPVDQEIQITASNLHFVPTKISVKPGATVRFVVTNEDPYLHNFVSQEAGISLLNLPGNTIQVVTWTAPTLEGMFTALCTLHPGMSLLIEVKD